MGLRIEHIFRRRKRRMPATFLSGGELSGLSAKAGQVRPAAAKHGKEVLRSSERIVQAAMRPR